MAFQLSRRGGSQAFISAVSLSLRAPSSSPCASCCSCTWSSDTARPLFSATTPLLLPWFTRSLIILGTGFFPPSVIRVPGHPQHRFLLSFVVHVSGHPRHRSLSHISSRLFGSGIYIKQPHTRIGLGQHTFRIVLDLGL
ncbi:hypothetical protein C8T65DRAFT_646804 [Cerioporus squamosus]|nr:hypothetical protein C8T65DRAFT_646804 [Cerioporus squamosus]